ncbi:MAG: response regulator [Desulfovibrionaceae bacterium]|nr:response regulator [Desulfovibrionaceae bacterium]
MRIIAADDEILALKGLERVIRNVLPDCTLSCFDTAEGALEHARENHVDVAFLDIEMGGMNGLALARLLKDIHGTINIVFTTGHSRYAVDSYDVAASDYLLKPITKEAVAKAMARLREPVDVKAGTKIYVQTFGNFEVFVEGAPLIFARSKTKELLAYLIDRKGALCSNNEIIAAVWEERVDSCSLQNYFRQLVVDLTKTLKKARISDIVMKQRGQLAVRPDKFACDLYEFERGNSAAVRMYSGKYMAQYSWAEITNARLESMTTINRVDT